MVYTEPPAIYKCGTAAKILHMNAHDRGIPVILIRAALKIAKHISFLFTVAKILFEYPYF